MEHIHGLVIAKLLVLPAAANGTPVLVRWILRDWAGVPLDGGWCLADGRPLLGPSKTIRRLVCAIAATVLAAPMLGFSGAIGFIIGSAAMLGDLISSFTKRNASFTAKTRSAWRGSWLFDMRPTFTSRPPGKATRMLTKKDSPI